MFNTQPDNNFYLVRTDVENPLAAYSKYGFELDGAAWPSVEHYYQAMKFDEVALRESIRTADHPAKAAELAKANKKFTRKDWKDVRQVMMTRAIYTRCRKHESIAKQLLATGDRLIVETTMYDYFWGCGRDGRGHNTFGKVLMSVRDKLMQEQSAAGA